jgi:uncharacterized protein (TIGR02246 family)
MKTMFALILVALSCTAHGAENELPIRTLVERIVVGWNQGSGEAVAAVYADNGTLVAGDGTVKRGREAIARYHEQQFGTSLKDTQLAVRVTSVRFLSKTIALMHSEGGILSPGETELAPGRRGIQSFVVIKTNGAWRVALFQNTRVREG